MSIAPDSRTNDPSGRGPTSISEGFGSAVLPIPYQSAAMPTPRRRRLPPDGPILVPHPPPRAARSSSVGALRGTQAARRSRGAPGRSRSGRQHGARCAAAARADRSPDGRRARRAGARRRAACGTPKPRNAPAAGRSCGSHGSSQHGRHRRALPRGRGPGSRRWDPTTHRRRCRSPRGIGHPSGVLGVGPDRAVMTAGWRLVLARIDSGRVYVPRTGRRDRARPRRPGAAGSTGRACRRSRRRSARDDPDLLSGKADDQAPSRPGPCTASGWSRRPRGDPRRGVPSPPLARCTRARRRTSELPGRDRRRCERLVDVTARRAPDQHVARRLVVDRDRTGRQCRRHVQSVAADPMRRAGPRRGPRRRPASPTSARTGSPMWRTKPSARTGWSLPVS